MLSFCYFVTLTFTFCFQGKDVLQEKFNVEKYIESKHIRYKLWWNWPIFYDCGGIITEALRLNWYKGKKIHSRTFDCVRNNKYNAKKGDILINRNEEERHVAYITSDAKNGLVEILDFYQNKTTASRRIHWLGKNIYVLSSDCLYSIKK